MQHVQTANYIERARSVIFPAKQRDVTDPRGGAQEQKNTQKTHTHTHTHTHAFKICTR